MSNTKPTFMPVKFIKPQAKIKTPTLSIMSNTEPTFMPVKSIKPQAKIKTEARHLFRAPLFKGSIYDPFNIIRGTANSKDRLSLPLMEDRIFGMKNMFYNATEEHYRCLKKLSHWKTKYLLQLSVLQKQWKSLERDERLLRKNMMIYNHFVRENVVKRERCEENIKHYKKLSKKYEDEIESMKANIGRLNEVRTLMKEQIAKHSIYPKFLSEVISFKSDFKSLSSLSQHIELLYVTLEETAKSFEEKKNQLENLNLEMSKQHIEHLHTVQSLLHRLGVLNETYVEAVNKAKDHTYLLSNIKLETGRYQHDSDIAKEIINEIYSTICYKQGFDPFYDKKDYENQLKVIKYTMGVEENIIHDLENNMIEKDSRTEESEDESLVF